MKICTGYRQKLTPVPCGRIGAESVQTAVRAVRWDGELGEGGAGQTVPHQTRLFSVVDIRMRKVV